MLLPVHKIELLSLRQIENRVCGKSNKEQADREYFKKMIFKYIKNDGTQQWDKFLWKMIWIRNHKGKCSQYLYFNKYTQKIFIEQLFWEWAKRISSEISGILTKAGNNRTERNRCETRLLKLTNKENK